jgi:hypothetical protein
MPAKLYTFEQCLLAGLPAAPCLNLLLLLLLLLVRVLLLLLITAYCYYYCCCCVNTAGVCEGLKANIASASQGHTEPVIFKAR